MSPKPVIPDGSMTPHQNHTINESKSQEGKGKILKNKNQYDRSKRQYPKPTGKSKPVLSGFENVYARKILPKELLGRGLH